MEKLQTFDTGNDASRYSITIIVFNSLTPEVVTQASTLGWDNDIIIIYNLIIYAQNLLCGVRPK